jgi:GGDEF domain-containing protein
MSGDVKTILIVEDEKKWKDSLALLCQKAHKKVYGNAGNIIAVSTLDEARHELKKQRVHFASVDLNLEEDAKGSKDPGGLRLLAEIYKKKLGTVSIVVSGEYNPDFAAISKKYGALTFQQKREHTFPLTYLTAVEAAFLYTEAKELLDKGKYNEARTKWMQAKEVIKPIGEFGGEAGDWTFPVDIEQKYRDNFKHPITHLPTSLLIEEQIKIVKESAEAWTLLYFGIRNINAFKEVYGPIQVNDVLIFLTDIMRETVEAQGTPNDFIGQVSDNDFIIITTPEAAPLICTTITQRFNEESGTFYSFPDRERGTINYKDIDGASQKAGFMKISVGIVSSKDGPFGDIMQITEDAAKNRRENVGCPE